MVEHHDNFEATQFRPGERIGHYELLEEFGRGGMGVVYKAQDLNLDRVVALKCPWRTFAKDELAIRRFVREGKLASSLTHPNIIPIYEVFEHDDHPWLAMQLLTGGSLKGMLAREGKQSPVRVAGFGEDLASAIQYAHAQGVLHRDLNPNNILLGANGQPLITDFGLAKRIFHPKGESGDTSQQSTLTGEGVVMGTLNYMSPEQTLGRSLDGRSDIFSLGSVLYEMCTGEVPFKDSTRNQVIDAIIHREPAPIGQFTYEVPGELERIIRKCMAKNVEARYQEPRDLIVDLRALRKDLEYREYSASHVVAPAPKPKRFFWPALLVGMLLVAAPLGVWWAARHSEAPLPAGPTRQVTSAVYWEGEPALSADGSKVAYAANENGNFDIRVVDVRGGKPFLLTTDPASDREPSWFPDGSAVVFSSNRSGIGSVWKAPQFGGGATILVENAASPAVSPDGTRIAFVRNGPAGVPRIWVAELNDPNQARQLTDAESGLWDHSDPAWSPDGTRIAYAAFDGVWLVDAAGGKPRPLTTDQEFDMQPCWSPNGRFVYFASFRQENTALWRVAVEDGYVQQLTPGTGPETNPSLAGNGRFMAYSTGRILHSIMVRDLDSGEESAIAAAVDDLFPSMAPDGSAVVFASDRWSSNFDLWIQNLEDGQPVGEPERLTDQEGIASHPQFSPDGELIVYYRILNQQRDIWVVPRTGGQPVKVTDHAGNSIHPDWSSDGRHLVYSSDHEGTADIWVLPLEDGKVAGEPRALTAGEESDHAPVWSPDGKTVAFNRLVGSQSDVWVVQASGGAARKVTDSGRVRRVAWDPRTLDLLVSSEWGEDRVTLKRFSSVDGKLIDNEVFEFGDATANVQFDVSKNGELMAYTRGTRVGDVWIMESTHRPF